MGIFGHMGIGRVWEKWVDRRGRQMGVALFLSLKKEKINIVKYHILVQWTFEFI